MTGAIAKKEDITGESQLIEDVKKLKQALNDLPEPMVKPFFIVVSGLPGTGKSYFCRKLVERLPSIILESDALRKVLFPSPSYSHEESSYLFQACHYLIEELLQRGVPLILDATNLEERHRERLYHIAEKVGARLILVQVEAPPEVVRQRLDERVEGIKLEDASEADWNVYQRMKHNAQRIARNHFVVDTSRDITPVINKIVRQANR